MSQFEHPSTMASNNAESAATLQPSCPPTGQQLSGKTLPLAERALNLPGSPIRALLSSARGSGRLDLGGGIPDPALFPDKLMARVAAELLARHSAEILQYAPTEGFLPLREFIAQRLVQRGCPMTPEQILITHGSQQALACVAALLTSPDHAVALEQPVYPGAVQAFALAQAPTVALPVTRDGWDLQALRGADVSAIYVIPNHQNPTGRRATEEQRLELARHAESTGTFIIEDDAYGELDFTVHDSRPVIADTPTRGILLGTFSKTLCPGLRVGWIAAPGVLIEPLTRVLQASCLQPGTLSQHLACSILQRLDWLEHLTGIRNTYARRASALRDRCSALGLSSEMPKGGFFLWVKCRGSASALAEHAIARGVVAVPERAFRLTSHSGHDRHLRLSFTRFDDNQKNREQLRVAFEPTDAHQNQSRPGDVAK